MKPFYLKREKQKESENIDKTIGQVIICSLGDWHCCCLNSINSSPCSCQPDIRMSDKQLGFNCRLVGFGT